MKNVSLRAGSFAALYFGVNAVYQGYIAKYYQQQGVSEQTLALLLLSFPAISMLSLPCWGGASDRSPRPRLVLQGVLVLSALATLLFSKGTLLLACAAFACCYPAIQPLGDSLILRGLEKNNKPYGPVRLAGCLTFAVVSLLLGRLLRDDYSPIPVLTGIGLILLLAASFFLPEERKPAQQKKGTLPELLRLPGLPRLLVLYMALQMTLGLFYNFFPLLFTGLPGADSGLLGWAYFVSSLSEVPFLLLGDRLLKRWGPGRLLLIAAFSMTLRYAILGLTNSLGAAMASQLLHGSGFVVITFAMARHVSETVPPALRARGQTLLSVAGFGFSRACGVLLGGWMNARMGLQTAFLIMSAAALTAFFIFLPSLRKTE